MRSSPPSVKLTLKPKGFSNPPLPQNPLEQERGVETINYLPTTLTKPFPKRPTLEREQMNSRSLTGFTLLSIPLALELRPMEMTC